MKFPSINDVADALRNVSMNVDCDEDGCDVRLQVYNDGMWTVRWGDASFDQDHHGSWGVSSVPGIVDGKQQRFNSKDIARDLIEQVKDQYEEIHS